MRLWMLRCRRPSSRRARRLAPLPSGSSRSGFRRSRFGSPECGKLIIHLSGTSDAREIRGGVMPQMNERRLNLSDIILIGATRGMLGAGIGLLAAGKLSGEQRRAIGRTLVLVGAVTTIPLAMRVFGQK